MRRDKDANSTETFDAFPDGATLAELEEFIRLARERGAPDDAKPRAKLNEENEIVGFACTTKRQE